MTKRGFESSAIFSSTVLSAGTATFHFVIHRTLYPDAHLFVGVADVADVVKPAPNPNHFKPKFQLPEGVEPAGNSWGLDMPTGGLYLSEDKWEFGQEQKRPLMEGDLIKADPRVVEVTVDMDAHTLSFAVNGQPWYDAGVVLPAAVRPYIFCCHAGDEVTLEMGPVADRL